MARYEDEVVGIHVPLTEEQKREIREATGREVHEVVVVGEASSDRARNQVGTYLDQAIVRKLWKETQALERKVEKRGAGGARAQWKTAKDRQPPPRLALVR